MSAKQSPAEQSSPSGTRESAQAPAAADPPVIQAIPPATGNNAVITVKVGGNRTSLTAVGNLAGVTLGFYDTSTGGTPALTCVSDVDGDCSITVPNTQGGGANRDRRFWVRQISTAAGYYTNPSLGTGTTVAADTYQFQTGSQLRNASTYTSQADFMISTGTTNNEASGGIWQNSLNNPNFPAKCGINVALVLDLSNSVSDAQLVQLKAAATGFVDALTGTPSQVGTFTFATSAPASTGDTLSLTSVSTAGGATTVKNKINGYAKPGGNAGGTNWDRGLYQVAQSTSSFDVAVVITDGNPTFYGAGEGPGNRTRFREVENGIFSANAIKAENTKVIAFGVGDGIDNAGSGQNLRSISGPTLNTDYYQTADYSLAGAQLKALALGSCTGSVTVVKQVVPAGGSGITGATPQGGWTFTGTGSTGITVNAPTSRVTAGGTGAANFPLTFAGGTTTGPVTLDETQQAGYTLVQVGGANAVCTRVDTGATVTVTNSGTTGFTVAAASAYPISCVVYNRAPQPLASVVLHKLWVINGAAAIPDGQQPTGLIATGTLNGSTVPWEQEQGGFRQGDSVTVSEATNISGLPLCTLVSARLTKQNDTTVNVALPSSQTLIGGTNNYTMTNTVTCDTRLKLTKTVLGGPAAPTDWSLISSTRIGGQAGPTGTTGVNATVTPNTQYVLSETNPHPEYVQFLDPNAVLIPGSSGSWTCQEVQADGNTVISGFSDGLNGGVTVPFGRYVRCNAVNETSTLTLRKVVQNTHGGTATPNNWQLTATPTGTFPAGLPPQTVTGSPTSTSFNVRPGVAYALTESGGPAGYSLSSLTCDVVGSPSVDSLALNPLDAAVCTFKNDDTPAHLTLVKTVTNDNGGTATPTQWNLTATGPTPISGATGSASVTNAEVSAGSYTLGESDGPGGYAPGAWSCTGATVTGATVTVPTGGNVSCTINNNDQPGTLTLVKQVVNDNGGTALATAWTLSATGPTPGVSGPTGSAAVTNRTVNAGGYVLSESALPGYAAGSWSCTGGTLSGTTVTVSNGAAVTCTIVNDDQPAHLTLVKNVINDNGGTATPGQWTLSANGPTPISGAGNSASVTNQPVNAGNYALSESGGPAGYAAGSWSCNAGT
ncbi:MAG: VWA domain-containing protein, partial [Dermatophilaceae bacterium]